MQTDLSQNTDAGIAAAPRLGVSITVDIHEPADYPAQFTSLGADVKKVALQVGDYIVSDRCAIERKTRQDFEASIVDGRLFSQAGNLCASYERPVMIVEGRPNLSSGISKNALLGAYASLVCDYGLSVFFVKSKNAFCRLVLAFAKYEQKGRGKMLPVYAKRKSLSIEKMQLAVLESMPMIGPKYARNLLVHFGTLKNVANAPFDELVKVKGLGKKRATIISNLLGTPYVSNDAPKQGRHGIEDYSNESV